ncbi:fatty acid desaturase [Scopulibacillus daqui]|uniref:Fatty acid desaturase n=1 Tax=Scopulibacillus daqui TaxID=1469162 RepID=A0ABS2PWS0_9BACL|nr:hypothetical protein [Scopulibacillus daqui]MBM7643909.1 fatty acid desaturase [Scopulibacillus daqui]
MSISILACILIGAILIIIGGLIYIKKQLSFINNEKPVIEKGTARLVRTIGIVIAIIGIFTLFAPLLIYVIGTDYWVIYVAMGIVIILLITIARLK